MLQEFSSIGISNFFLVNLQTLLIDQYLLINCVWNIVLFFQRSYGRSMITKSLHLQTEGFSCYFVINKIMQNSSLQMILFRNKIFHF